MTWPALRRLGAFLRRDRLDDELAEEIGTITGSLEQRAPHRRAVTFIIRKVLKPVVIGLLAGLGLGAAAARVLGAVLYGISPFDPAAFTGAVAFLVAAATFAAGLPARRAATVDPLRALRSE